MKVFSIAKGFYRLSKQVPPELSQKEFDRLRALTVYEETVDGKLSKVKLGKRKYRAIHKRVGGSAAGIY
jgi:hypothetical protein